MQCAVDFNDDIMAAWNTIEKKYSVLTNSFWDHEKQLRASLSSQSQDITLLKKEALTKKLTGNGVTFTKSKSGRLPELDVRFDWNICRIIGLRILRMTSSGKSADLEITQKSDKWDSATSAYIEGKEMNTFSRVRMDKVEQLMRFAERRDQLVA